MDSQRYAGFVIALSLAAAVPAAAAVSWEGVTNTLALTGATTVEIPAGTTGIVHALTGAYPLTKTGGGTLIVRYPKSSDASFVVSEGTLLFASNRRPDEVFAKAVYHVDASDLSTMTLVEENGTNFVTRWNDADGRNVYAEPSGETIFGRTDPEKRLPYIGTDSPNGLPYVDFGSLLVPGYTDENGASIGYGAALEWNKSFSVREGFTVVSDMPDIAGYAARISGHRGHHGMSFFSHWDDGKGWSGVRGTLDDEKAPAIYTSNSQNNSVYGTGCTNWIDGASVGYTTAFPAGFHLFSRSASGSTVSRFAMEFVYNAQSYFGGQRIAEYAVFTNRLEESERLAVNDYLMVKWGLKPVSVASIEVAAGAACIIGDDVGFTVKEIFDANDGSFVYTGETVSSDILSKVGAWIHLDASRADTMTTVAENGTNYVTQWRDADGGSKVALPDASVGSGSFRTDPGKRRPYLNPVLRQNGRPVVDLGSALFNNHVNDNTYGAAFYFKGCTDWGSTPSVKEYLAVIADTEDLKTVPTGSKFGPAYFAYCAASAGGSSYGGMVEGRRGPVKSGQNPPLFESDSASATSTGENNGRFKDDGTAGRTFVNGCNVSYVSSPPDGFNVINIRPYVACKNNLIGRYQRNSYSTYGGQRIAEYMIFTSRLDDVKRERLYRALRCKWFGDAPLMWHGYNNLTVGDGAVLDIAWEGVTVTNTLTLAGTVAAPLVEAGHVVSRGGSVEGALSLKAGATLSFTRRADGTWPVLSATSLAAAGAVSVGLSAADVFGLGGSAARLLALDTPPAAIDGWSVSFDGGLKAELSLEDDGVWVVFRPSGNVILIQ